MNYEQKMHPSTPKYVQLIEAIKADIQSAVLVPEQQLPNEDELAAQYRMSRGTVRKAIDELQRMGLLRKEQGRGTFVNEPEPALNGFSLVELDAYIQAQSRVPTTETLRFEIMPAAGEIAEKLEIPVNSDLVHIEQLRLASGMPVVYEERFFAKSLCPDITQSSVEQNPIHRLLVDKYQVPLLRLTHTIEIAELPQDKLALFKLNAPVSVFRVDRLSFTKTGDKIRPAVWYHALFRADEYQFQAQFHSSF